MSELNLTTYVTIALAVFLVITIGRMMWLYHLSIRELDDVVARRIALIQAGVRNVPMTNFGHRVRLTCDRALFDLTKWTQRQVFPDTTRLD